MNKTHGMCCIAIGTILLIAALSLVFYNVDQNKKSGEAAYDVLVELQEIIPDVPATTEPTTVNSFFAEYEHPTEPVIVEDPTTTIDMRGYLGIISIPRLELELPVVSDWSYPNLRIAPCRYKGSISGDDIIIAAHNYRSHFGRLQELSGGEEIFFTDVDGFVHCYEVTERTEINGQDIEQMDFGSAEQWDLTLFTCTLSGQSRVTVRAVRCEEE